MKRPAHNRFTAVLKYKKEKKNIAEIDRRQDKQSKLQKKKNLKRIIESDDEKAAATSRLKALDNDKSAVKSLKNVNKL